MLYLNRKVGEAVIVNHDIEVRVVAISGKTVKLGFTFPPGGERATRRGSGSDQVGQPGSR